jgi:hypothetical protein
LTILPHNLLIESSDRRALLSVTESSVRSRPVRCEKPEAPRYQDPFEAGARLKTQSFNTLTNRLRFRSSTVANAGGKSC